MKEFNWMPLAFWISAGLSLIPAGLAMNLSNPKKVISTSMVAQFGIFLLIITLGMILPAIIYLTLTILINTLLLYGNLLFPSDDDITIKRSLLSSFLRSGICLIVFFALIGAFFQSRTTTLSGESDVFSGLVPEQSDISVLMILLGLLFLVLLVVINNILKSK